MLAWHCSLVLGFNLPGLIAPLVYTHESDTPKKALSRYTATFGHLAQWHTGGDIFDPSSASFSSVGTVRTFHATVRKNMNRDEPRSKPTDAFWISAYNMGCVQSGFCGAVTLVPAQFGLTPTNGGSEEELARYVGFWRCVARQLRLDDRYNLCGGGEKIADTIIREVIDEVILPDAAHPVPEVSPMSEAYVGGINRVFCGCKVFTVKSTLAYSMDGLKRPFPKGMTLCDYVRFSGLKICVWLVTRISCVRLLLNWGARRTFSPPSLSREEMVEDSESLESALVDDSTIGVCPASGHILLRHRRGNFKKQSCTSRYTNCDISKGPSCHVAASAGSMSTVGQMDSCCCADCRFRCRCEPLCLVLAVVFSAFLASMLAAFACIGIGIVELTSRSHHFK